MRIWNETRMRTVVLMGWILAAGLAIAVPGGAADHGPDPERLSRRVSELETRNAALEAQAAARAAELERYRDGLERAVAELNRLRGQRLTEPPRRSAHGTAVDVVKDRVLSVARVQVEGRRAVVTGEMRNNNLNRLAGTLTIELLRDGQPIDSVHLPLEIAPVSRAPYERAFALDGYAAGSYEARAYFSY